MRVVAPALHLDFHQRFSQMHVVTIMKILIDYLSTWDKKNQERTGQRGEFRLFFTIICARTNRNMNFFNEEPGVTRDFKRRGTGGRSPRDDGAPRNWSSSKTFFPFIFKHLLVPFWASKRLKKMGFLVHKIQCHKSHSQWHSKLYFTRPYLLFDARSFSFYLFCCVRVIVNCSNWK